MRAPADSTKPTTGIDARSAISMHAHDGVGVGSAERAAGEPRILREAGDRTPVDGAGGPEHTVAVLGPVAHLRRAHQSAKQVQRAGVAEDLEALERRQTLVGALYECKAHQPLLLGDAASSTSAAL